jgi:hypothetical protein
MDNQRPPARSFFCEVRAKLLLSARRRLDLFLAGGGRKRSQMKIDARKNLGKSFFGKIGKRQEANAAV